MHKRAEVGLQDIPKTRVGRNTGCHKTRVGIQGVPNQELMCRMSKKQDLVNRMSKYKSWYTGCLKKKLVYRVSEK